MNTTNSALTIQHAHNGRVALSIATDRQSTTEHHSLAHTHTLRALHAIVNSSQLGQQLCRISVLIHRLIGDIQRTHVDIKHTQQRKNVLMMAAKRTRTENLACGVQSPQQRHHKLSSGCAKRGDNECAQRRSNSLHQLGVVEGHFRDAVALEHITVGLGAGVEDGGVDHASEVVVGVVYMMVC